MTLEQLNKKVEQYVSEKKRKTKIVKFARGIGALFVLLGSLIVAYGITISFSTFYTFFFPEATESLVSIPIIGTIWNGILKLFASKEISMIVILIAVALLSCILSSIITLLFASMCKREKFEITKNEENLQNAKFVKELDFELYARIGDRANKSNRLSNMLYLICALAIFITIACQTGEKVYIICGVVCAFIFYILFWIIRSFYILLVRGLWKEDTLLRMEIENEFRVLIPRLENEEAEHEAELERQKQMEIERKKQEKLINDISQGQKMYEIAVSSDPVDEKMMKEAAKLGSISACYYLGKHLLSDLTSDMLTDREKEELAEEAAKYFDVARQLANLTNMDGKSECQFLWLYSRLQYESNNKSEWQQMLNEFRSLQKATDLSEEYKGLLELSIKQVVNVINRLESEASKQTNIDINVNDTRWEVVEPVPSSSDLSEEDAWHAVASGMMGGPGIDSTGM